MFLTRKTLTKISLLTVAYFALGVFCFLVSDIFASIHMEGRFLVSLGTVCFTFGVLYAACGKYGEGTAKLINSGNKLVLQQLRPAEFIHLYEEKRDCPDNVISKPDFDVLKLLVTAYDALGDLERQMETLDQMLFIASEKKKPFINVWKTALLYNMGKVDDANLLYSQVQSTKMDFATKATLDVLIKSDRAMALGDYTTAEAFYKQMLIQKFPKNTPLSILYAHFNLAKIYSSTDRDDQAKTHLHYCVENGGETGVRADAVNMLKYL